MSFSRSNIQITATAFFILLCTLGYSPFAHAQGATQAPPPIDILPAATAQERGMQYDSEAHTHPALKLTPDKSELVRLDKAAGSIIIGNPNHLSILADTSKTLVLVPRAPGATHFTVLDMDGAVLMQRHVIVASPKEKYLRVRRSCAGSGDDSCQQTSVFYCPDMCHEIIMGSEDGGDSSGAEGEGGAAGQPNPNNLSEVPDGNDTE